MVHNAIYDESVNSNKFISFVKRIQSAYGDEPFIMYMDSLRAHTSAKSMQYLVEQGIIPIWAPYYSPLLNPAEMYISKVKCYVRRERFHDLVVGENRQLKALI